MQYSHFHNAAELAGYLGSSVWSGSGLFAASDSSTLRSQVLLRFRNHVMSGIIRPEKVKRAETGRQLKSQNLKEYRFTEISEHFVFDADLFMFARPGQTRLQLQALSPGRAHLTVQSGPGIYYSGTIKKDSALTSGWTVFKNRSLFAVLDTAGPSEAIVRVYDFHLRTDSQLR